MDSSICEFCKKKHATKSFHCNHCEKPHKICALCIIKYKTKMNLRKVHKKTIFDSNLAKWAWYNIRKLFFFYKLWARTGNNHALPLVAQMFGFEMPAGNVLTCVFLNLLFYNGCCNSVCLFFWHFFLVNIIMNYLRPQFIHLEWSYVFPHHAGIYAHVVNKMDLS